MAFCSSNISCGFTSQGVHSFLQATLLFTFSAGFTSFTTNNFAFIADTFAFVRFRLFQSADFGSNTGWSAARHDRMLADLNGDGRADIVAWGDNGMRVALSDGDSFNEVDPELFYVTNGNTTDPLLMV